MNVVEAADTVVYTMLCKAMALYHQYHLDKQPACKTIVLKLCASDFWGCTYPANVYSIDSLHFFPIFVGNVSVLGYCMSIYIFLFTELLY